MRTLLTCLMIVMLGIRPAHAEYDHVDACEESTYRIVSMGSGTSYSTGSGFLINNQGYLVTNVHVIDGYSNIYVVQARGDQIKVWRADVHSNHKAKDLAILKVPGLNGRPVTFAAQKPKKASTVYAVGFPGQADDKTEKNKFMQALLRSVKAGRNDVPMDPDYDDFATSSIKRGVIESFRTIDWGYPNPMGKCLLIYHDAPITPGNSGGPLFNNDGELIGINTRIKRENRVDGQLVGNQISLSSMYTELTHILDSGSIAYLQSKPGQGGVEPAAMALSGGEPAQPEVAAPGRGRSAKGFLARLPWVKTGELKEWLAPGLIALGAVIAGCAIFLVLRGRNPRPSFANRMDAAIPDAAAAPVVAAAPWGFDEVQPQEPDYGMRAALDEPVVCRLRGTDSKGRPVDLKITEDHLSGPDGCTIGRSSQSVIRIDDDSISRRHIKLKRSRKGLYISDAGSSNGSILNGKKLKPKVGVVIHQGDRIKMGDVSLAVQQIEG